MYIEHRRSPPLLRTSAAILCLCVGVIGLVLPLIPGIPFLIVGALLLRRRGSRPLGTPVARTGLSGIEQLQLQFWLLARRITTGAEAMRVAWRRRARQRDR